MKKILLFIIAISLSFSGFSQLDEDFENATFPPAGWTTFIGANGLGTVENWEEQEFPVGNKGAVCGWEDFAGNNVLRSEDWLVTMQFTVDPAMTQLSFDNVDSGSTDYGSIYTVRVSTASQTTHADFTIVDTQTELDIAHSQSILAGFTRSVDLSAYAGQAIYVAFVMAQDDGDLWRLDNIRMESATTCSAPTDMVVSNITTTSADLSWTAGAFGTATSYSIEYGATGFTQGSGTTVTSNTTSVSLSPLAEATGYDFYIIADCGTTDGLSIVTDATTFYTIATPYNVGVGHTNPSNNIENGANCDADNATAARTVAHDIVVPANTTFSLTKIVPHVLMLPTITATSVKVTIYEDAGGLPGTVVNTQASVVPTSSKTTGTNFGYIVNELELDLTPVDLVNTTGADKTFWIGISVSKSDGAGGSPAFWENTTASIIGAGQAYDDGVAGFVVDAAIDGVYSFVANTSTASVEDDKLAASVAIYPTTINNVFTIKNDSNTALTNLTIFDINGRVVQKENLHDLIGSKSITISNLTSGLYFVELNSANGKLVKKIIKK